MKKDDVRISVLMGIFNCADTLPEALDSMLAQTYQGFKLIMCDDGSTDNTYEVAKIYADRYDNFILIKNEKNIKLAATLNHCLEYADTEYVARMDGDDISEPDRFAAEIAFLDSHPEYAIVSCPMKYFDQDGVYQTGKAGWEVNEKHFLKGSPICHAPCMVRREALLKVDGYSVETQYERVEDYRLWFKMYAAGYKAYMLDRPYYRMRDDRNASVRRTWQNRKNEFFLKWDGLAMLNLPWYCRVYALRPLLVGMIPKLVYDNLHKKNSAKKEKIYVHPLCKVNYASYFLNGMENSGYQVEIRPFEIPDVLSLQEYRRGMFCMKKDGRKVYIDFHDSNDFNPKYYEWSDVYAMVNFKGEMKEKMVVLGPSFGVSLSGCPIFSVFKGFWHWMKYLRKGRTSYRPSLKSYVGDYIYTFVRRRKLSKYISDEQPDPDYCFTANTLWYDSLTNSTTNPFRAAFCRAAKRVYPRFEGGLMLISAERTFKEFPEYAEYRERYSDVMMTKRFGPDEYLEKTRRSHIVFNTPSVLGCHGWKLGEYMAMGKCILSMPHNNMFPAEFVSGIHYLEIGDATEMSAAINLLKNSPEKVDELGKNARAYFDSYLSPAVMIGRIFG